MIQSIVEETAGSLEQIQQELDQLAHHLSADWFRLHAVLQLLEALAEQYTPARQALSTSDPLFRAFLVLRQAEDRAAALQQQLGEAQGWLQLAEARLAGSSTQATPEGSDRADR
jgi:DNA repair ATPase RecN